MTTIFTDILERHADEAAFLRERRDRAAASPLFDLRALAEVDDRLDANLEGLVIARADGLAAAQGALAHADARGSATEGELFVAVFVAAELSEPMELAKLLVRAEQDPKSARAIVSALAWLSPPRADAILAELSAPSLPPALTRLAVRILAATRPPRATGSRADPHDLLTRALSSSDAELRARALQAAGELGRRDLLPELRAAARASEPEPWAAWSAALLGDPEAVPVLWSLAARADDFAKTASALAARLTPAPEAAAHLAALAAVEASVPAALAGAAALGDPASLAWALPLLAAASADLSRAAAWVYATITGVRLAPPLAVRKPTVDPSIAALTRARADVLLDLPHPDPEAIAAHWSGARADFPEGVRRLGGRVLDAESAQDLLRTGLQPWRASAAFELAAGKLPVAGRPPSSLSPLGIATPIFPVAAPASHQRARLLPAT